MALWFQNIVFIHDSHTMATEMDISAPGDEASPSTINPISTFPTFKTAKELLDKLLTHKIHEYCKGKLINDHDLFAILKLNYEKLETFTGKLEDGQISQRLKLCILKLVQEVENDNSVDTSTKPKKFKKHSKMTIMA